MKLVKILLLAALVSAVFPLGMLAWDAAHPGIASASEIGGGRPGPKGSTGAAGATGPNWTTCAQLSSGIAGAEHTGSCGAVVLSTSATLTTPTLSGNTTAGTINSTTIPSSATLTKTADNLSVFSSTTSAQLATLLSDEVGTGFDVFATGANITGPWVLTGVSGTTGLLINSTTNGVALVANGAGTSGAAVFVGGASSANGVNAGPGATITGGAMSSTGTSGSGAVITGGAASVTGALTGTALSVVGGVASGGGTAGLTFSVSGPGRTTDGALATITDSGGGVTAAASGTLLVTGKNASGSHGISATAAAASATFAILGTGSAGGNPATSGGVKGVGGANSSASGFSGDGLTGIGGSHAGNSGTAGNGGTLTGGACTATSGVCGLGVSGTGGAASSNASLGGNGGNLTGGASATSGITAGQGASITGGAASVTGATSGTGLTVTAGAASGGATAALYALWSNGKLAITGGLKFLTGGINGVTDASNATAGDVGEYISSALPVASAVTGATTVVKNITSIALTAGDWDVTGICCIDTSITGTIFSCGISTTTATMPAASARGDSWVQTPTVSTATADSCIDVPDFRFTSSTGSTTHFLVSSCTDSGGTCTMYGRLSARRVR